VGLLSLRAIPISIIATATHIIIPYESWSKLSAEFKAMPFTKGWLLQNLSCIVGTFHAQLSQPLRAVHDHSMGIVKGGTLAILAGVGPWAWCH